MRGHRAQNIVDRVRAPERPPGRRRRQPAARELAGVLDIDRSVKARALRALPRRVQHPPAHLLECPGFCRAPTQEWGGIIRRGAKLLFAFTEATVPKLTVITRKAYGGAYDVMSSKRMLADFNFAWPTAEVAVMGREGGQRHLPPRPREVADARRAPRKLIADYKAPSRTRTPRPSAATSTT